jgi:hypothetical protein
VDRAFGSDRQYFGISRLIERSVPGDLSSIDLSPPGPLVAMVLKP